MCAIRRSPIVVPAQEHASMRGPPVSRREGANAAIQNIHRTSRLELSDAHRLGRADRPAKTQVSAVGRSGHTKKQQPGHSLEPHRQRDLSRRRWPDPRLARDGHPPRSHSRRRQRHRAPLRTLHRSPLVPRSVTRCGRRQRSSRRDARHDTQSAATNRAGVCRRVG